MKNVKRILAMSLAILYLFLLSACGQKAADSPAATASAVITETTASAGTEATTAATTAAPKPVGLTISAAASLKDAMEDIEKLYTAANPRVSITFNFGSSGSLQQQIEQGADADVFISAGAKQMAALKDKGLLVDETAKNLLQNEVVLIIPKDSTVVSGFADLTSDKVKQIALGEPKSVPAGQYAEDVLTSLGILDKIKGKTVYAKDVREVLTWVETGNADAGIVYLTDALVSDKVKVAANAPSDSHKPIYYPVGVIKASKNTDAAKAFVDYLHSDKAKPVFEKYGFKFLQ